MLKALKGLLMTFSIDSRLAIKEIFRRIIKKPYNYRGIVVKTDMNFRIIMKYS